MKLPEIENEEDQEDLALVLVENENTQPKQTAQTAQQFWINARKIKSKFKWVDIVSTETKAIKNIKNFWDENEPNYGHKKKNNCLYRKGVGTSTMNLGHQQDTGSDKDLKTELHNQPLFGLSKCADKKLVVCRRDNCLEEEGN